MLSRGWSARLRPQARYVARVTGLLIAPKVNAGIQGRWLSYLQQMDGGLAAKARRPRPRFSRRSPPWRANAAIRTQRMGHHLARRLHGHCRTCSCQALHALYLQHGAWRAKRTSLLMYGKSCRIRLHRECFPPGNAHSLRARSAPPWGTCTRRAGGEARRPCHAARSTACRSRLPGGSRPQPHVHALAVRRVRADGRFRRSVPASPRRGPPRRRRRPARWTARSRASRTRWAPRPRRWPHPTPWRCRRGRRPWLPWPPGAASSSSDACPSLLCVSLPCPPFCVCLLHVGAVMQSHCASTRRAFTCGDGSHGSLRAQHTPAFQSPGTLGSTARSAP